MDTSRGVRGKLVGCPDYTEEGRGLPDLFLSVINEYGSIRTPMIGVVLFSTLGNIYRLTLTGHIVWYLYGITLYNRERTEHRVGGELG